MIYVPVTTGKANALVLTAGMRQLARPTDQSTNGTLQIFGILIDNAGAPWLAVDETFQLRFSVKAEIGEIARVLAEAGLAAQTVRELTDEVVARRGTSVVLWDLFPAAFKNAAKTEAQLRALNLFPAKG